MKAKIPWEGLTDSEADVSATVETSVLFERLSKSNTGDLVMLCAGTATTLDLALVKYMEINLLNAAQALLLSSIIHDLIELGNSIRVEQEP